MIPLRDDVPSRTVPLITVALIVLNVIAYVYQYSLDLDTPAGQAARALDCLHLDARRSLTSPGLAFVCEFGVIPCRLSLACPGPADFPPAWVTVFTAMFLHGDLLHLGGNMLYLWIFGNNVEDILGHGRFLIFYTVAGGAAAAAQTWASPGSAVPMIGASGAVSGVLGAYLLLFPYARVLTLVAFGFFIRLMPIRALFVLGFWFALQLAQSLLSVRVSGPGGGGGVAWFAHVGGFLSGIVLLFLLRPRGRARL
jgi:membrane associated rhomboid family serine protease